MRGMKTLRMMDIVQLNMKRTLWIYALLLVLAACVPSNPIRIVITPTPEVTGTTMASSSEATAPTSTAIITSERLSPTPRVGEVNAAGPVIDESYQLPPTNTPKPLPTMEPQPSPSPDLQLPVEVTPWFDVPYLNGQEMGVQMYWNVTIDEWWQWMQRLKPLNVSWVKMQINWGFVEPVPGDFNNETFRLMELHIERAKSEGFKTLLSIAKAPGWARNTDQREDGPPDDPQAYANFIRVLLNEMGESIDAIEIWNEPNLAREWRGTLEFSGVGYMRLFAPAYEVIRAYSSEIAIITAGLAPTGIVPGETISDREYLQQMYDAGLGEYSDVYIGSHPFGWSNPPDALCCDLSPEQGFDDQPQFFFLNNLNDTRSIMERNGHGDRQIWVTEFGWPSWEGLPDPAPYEWMQANTALEQAEFAVRAFQIGQERPDVGPMILWNINFANDTLIENRVELAAYSLFIPDIPIRPLYHILAQRPQ